MRKQRLMGAALVALSWCILLLALAGAEDGTAALLTLPLGLYMLFSEESVLYPDAGRRGEMNERRKQHGKETRNRGARP